MRINRDGTCTYQGRTYATLREALLAAGLLLRWADETRSADKIRG